MDLTVFFHAWTGGGDTWREPTAEFVAALARSGYGGTVHVGHVGSPDDASRLLSAIPSSRLAVHARDGFESVTLNVVREYARRADGAVLYAHTKGAGNRADEAFRSRWRRSMIRRVVEPWRGNLAILKRRCECGSGMVFGCCGRMLDLGECCCAPEAVTCSECGGTSYAVDAIGCHWLTEDEFPGMFGAMTVPAQGSGFFGGNFWMARCDYLRRLPVCEPGPRWQAEQWIGLGHPRVVDLLPGWPHDNRWPELCH